MRALKKIIKALVPQFIFSRLLSAYHFALAALSAALAGFPSRKIIVIGVTGTKGKTSTTEYLNAIFEKSGAKTALVNSIRIKVGTEETRNTMRMSMPGRFFMQNLLRDAVSDGCTVAILEMTSEGARQHRHRFIEMDALIFLNLAPEHIESHGSYEAYSDAKFSLARALSRSRKRPRVVVANADDIESARYLSIPADRQLPFSLSQVAPYSASDHGGSFTFEGTEMRVMLPGEFSLKNALAAAVCARAFGVTTNAIREGILSVSVILGRAQEIRAGQNFSVVVDYAHTPDSLEAIYRAYDGRRRICVLGSTGGGRDRWKRPEMGRIADKFCDYCILTNEDPYDERPEDIVDEIASGMKKRPQIIMDRREAIRHAIKEARDNDAVIITGKGTDPTIQGPRGTSIKWSDARVVEEELKGITTNSH